MDEDGRRRYASRPGCGKGNGAAWRSFGRRHDGNEGTEPGMPPAPPAFHRYAAGLSAGGERNEDGRW
jgi:hypothetical protein